MIAILAFIAVLQIVLALATVVFAWKIARLAITPSFPWLMIAAAFLCMLLYRAFTLFYLTDIEELYQHYPLATVWFSIVIQFLSKFFGFMGVATVYTLLSKKFGPIVK